jgi:hypothetical protein
MSQACGALQPHGTHKPLLAAAFLLLQDRRGVGVFHEPLTNATQTFINRGVHRKN